MPSKPDSVLDRHRGGYRIAHRLDAICHLLRRFHQTGAKRPPLYPFARAAAVQVDLCVPIALRQPSAGSQIARFAPTELQGNRMLKWIKP